MCAVCAEFGGQSVGIWVEASSIGCFSAVIAWVDRRTTARSWCRIWIGIIVFLGVSTGGEEYFSISRLICSNGNSLCILFISVCTHSNSVYTRGKVLVSEDTIVVIICGITFLVGKFACHIVITIGYNGVTCRVGKIYAGTIDWHILIVTTTRIIVGLIDLFVFGADISHYISFCFTSLSIVILYSSEVAQTLLAAPFRAESAVASRLISMKIPFNEETRSTLSQHSIISTLYLIASHTKKIWTAHKFHSLVEDIEMSFPRGFGHCYASCL